MTKYSAPFYLIIFLFLSSCSQDDTPNTCVAGTTNSSSFNDTEGDAAFSFIDIGSLSISINNCEIKAEITLSSAPTNLIYNSITVSDKSLEYQWQVKFDADGDGTAANDVNLSISNFKLSGSTQTQGNVPDFTQNNIWVVSSDGLSGSNVGSISANLAGSILTLVVNVSDNSALSNITGATPVSFETYYNASGTIYKDTFPDNGNYTN